MKRMKIILPIVAVLAAASVFYCVKYCTPEVPAEIPQLEIVLPTETSVKLLNATVMADAMEVYAQVREARYPDPVETAGSSGGGSYVYTGPVYTDGTSVNFDDLKAWNKDIVAYIYGPGTPINNAVAWTGSDYYLHTDLNHRESVYGAIYIAKENSSNFSDNNTILYGHHMKDGTMFASISGYKKGSSYYNAHPILYIYTPSRNYRVDVFAGFPCPHDDEVFATSYTSDQISSFISRSTFNSGIYPTHKTVLLCTCSYEHDNWRYVLLGDLVPID